MHGLIVVKNELLAARPGIARALLDAFAASHRYLARLRAGEKVSAQDEHYRRMAAIVGEPLPFGVEDNRPTLEGLIAFCRQQGLLRKACKVEEAFIEPGRR